MPRPQGKTIPLQDRPSHRHHDPIAAHDSTSSAAASTRQPNPGSTSNGADGSRKSAAVKQQNLRQTHSDDDSDEDDDSEDNDGMDEDDHHDNTTSLLRGEQTSHKRTSSTFSDDFASSRGGPGLGGSGGGPSAEILAKQEARKRYIYAGVFLVITLVSFVIQTELSAYVQQDLGWNKAYCMLYLTHGSWVLLAPCQLFILRLQDRFRTPWPVFWRRHMKLIRSTGHMVTSQDLSPPRSILQNTSPWPYLARTTAIVTSALTVAGLSWYIAVDMTSPSDLTAIYNCSAFFAYAFSVPLLKEKLRLDKSIAVLIAIAGVLVVAYGDSSSSSSESQGGGGGGEDDSSDPSAGPDDSGTRFLGNMIIGAGSVLYGLYEVLYKRWACPPEGVSPMRGTIFANVFGSCIGLFTLCVLWIPLPFLHWLQWEIFELPDAKTGLWLFISVIMNATFAGSFLVLISLTSPVLSSVASLLTIFIVAIADWVLKGETLSPAALIGGVGIIIAFLMLSWSTWREMTEEAKERKEYGGMDENDGVRLPVDDDDDDDEEGYMEERYGEMAGSRELEEGAGGRGERGGDR